MYVACDPPPAGAWFGSGSYLIPTYRQQPHTQCISRKVFKKIFRWQFLYLEIKETSVRRLTFSINSDLDIEWVETKGLPHPII